jgi:hypothetical protein
VDTKSLAHPARPLPEATRERGRCSGCGTIAKTLTAPRRNVRHAYRGPMYCLSCNPRFFTLDHPMVRLGEDGQPIDYARIPAPLSCA